MGDIVILLIYEEKPILFIYLQFIDFSDWLIRLLKKIYTIFIFDCV